VRLGAAKWRVAWKEEEEEGRSKGKGGNEGCAGPHHVRRVGGPSLSAGNSGWRPLRFDRGHSALIEYKINTSYAASFLYGIYALVKGTLTLSVWIPNLASGGYLTSRG
jgi:hypothetical protein